jgi:hypothetical protein
LYIVIHRGEIVEKAVRESGFSIVQLAKRMHKSRKWVYNSFENSQLPLDYVLQIGKIIHYDFSLEITEIQRPGRGLLLVGVPEVGHVNPEETLEYWKSKYYNLLEEYTEILKSIRKDR